MLGQALARLRNPRRPTKDAKPSGPMRNSGAQSRIADSGELFDNGNKTSSARIPETTITRRLAAKRFLASEADHENAIARNPTSKVSPTNSSSKSDTLL